MRSAYRSIRTVSRFEGTASGFAFSNSFADAGVRIEAQDTLTLPAGRDLYNLGGTLAAGGNLVIGAAEARDESFGWSKRSQSSTLKTSQYGSSVNSGGSLSALAGGDPAVIGSRFSTAGDATLAAGRDLTLAAAAAVSDATSTMPRARNQAKCPRNGRPRVDRSRYE